MCYINFLDILISFLKKKKKIKKLKIVIKKF